jgi:UDP-N-acetylglucosamine 2-epimerase
MKLLICYSSTWEYTKILPILSIYPQASTLYIDSNDEQYSPIEQLPYTHHIEISLSNTKNNSNGIISSISKNDDIFSLYNYILIVGTSSISIAIALTCNHLHKKIIHIDAGNSNSILSKLVDVHLCSTIEHSNFLTKENTSGSIFITGSTLIDTIKQIRPSIQLEKVILIHLENTKSNEEQWFTSIDKLTQLFPEFRFILCYQSTELQPYLYLLPAVSIIKSIEYLDLVQIISSCSIVISDNDQLLETCCYLQKKLIRCIPDPNLYYIDPNCFLSPSIELIVQTVTSTLSLPNTPNNSLYGDGSAISKISTIFTHLLNPIENKLLSISNYRMIQPINNQFGFIITSKVTNNTQQFLLLESIRHIRSIYPQHTIYLIDDLSMYPLKDNQEIISSRVTVIDSIAKGGGEINPYLFSIDPRCKHETLVYLHDSAFLKSSIDSFISSSKQSFLPIWYSKKFIWDDVFDPINQSIRNSMIFYSDDLANSVTLNDILLYFKANPKLQFVVTFSGMSIFHRSFVQFIKKYTNFFSIIHLFTCRKNRCLFERILSCIYFWIYRGSYTSSICGDINDHPMSFRNSNVYIDNYHNAFLKVWQGR